MPPFKYDGKFLIDGDIARGLSIRKIIPALVEDCIEFRITGSNKNKISKNPIKRIEAVVNSAAYIIDSEASGAIRIDVENVLISDFFLPLDRKKQIYKTGYDLTKNYFGRFK